jgi:hypothetical protein
MCDYSLLEHFKTRLAEKGETLVLTRFAGGTQGFISKEQWDHQAQSPGDLMEYCAVCLPPGARLSLDNAVGEHSHAEVTFAQFHADVNRHRDGVVLADGKQVSLQQMSPGLIVTVLSLEAEQKPEPELQPVGWLRRSMEMVGVGIGR